MDKVNVLDKFRLFTEQWSPKIVAQVNDYQVKIARIQGDFTWHAHDDTDEMFYVLEGTMRMDFEDREVPLEAGEMIVVPRGVQHKPHADDEAKIMMFEPSGTLNTGDVVNEFTRDEIPRV